MSRTLVTVSLVATLMGGTAFAAGPQVVADIAPVHSLVARVMQGVGMPDLVVQSGASPHEYSLRPSEAKALQNADLVFWIGPDLTPWLGDAIETLAPDAVVTGLLEADGTIELPFREGALFEAHDHGEDAADHEAEERHTDTAGEETGHDDHGAHDPHAWLSPQNAATWMGLIADRLAAADPENAGTYQANAAEGLAELDALTADIDEMLEPVRGGQFIVFHDAYQYFESAFDFPASGAISIGDASDPSPARIAEIRARIADEGIDCVLAEPQFNPGLVATVLDGTDAETAVLDPLGSGVAPGPALYPDLIRNLASALVKCL